MTTNQPLASDDDRAAPPAGDHSTASAPAKLILCGEHAVVYGRPAIALPLAGIRARARVTAGRHRSGIAVQARDLGRHWRVADDPGHPISELILAVLAHLGVAAGARDLRITIRSRIPIASGMGSGAAVATALVRALAALYGRELAPEAVSALVYASEQRFHGTPSGVDNAVVAFERPIWFQRMRDQRPPTIEPISIAAPFTLLIGDTGVRSATRAPVGDVRRSWVAEPARFEALFDRVGELVTRARALLGAGDVVALGPLLSHNHELLAQIGVSSPELDSLVSAALGAGALGAKLSGAGWGGVMLALVAPETSEPVSRALRAAGARRVLETQIDANTV
jgi:mevalonate kinase